VLTPRDFLEYSERERIHRRVSKKRGRISEGCTSFKTPVQKGKKTISRVRYGLKGKSNELRTEALHPQGVLAAKKAKKGR